MNPIAEELYHTGLASDLKLSRILSWCRSQKMQFNFELSTKFSYKSMSYSRALISLPHPFSKDDYRWQLTQLTELANLPPDSMRFVIAHYFQEHAIHFGIDQSADGTIYKLYFERLKNARWFYQNDILFSAIKWNSNLAGASTVSNYSIAKLASVEVAARRWTSAIQSLLCNEGQDTLTSRQSEIFDQFPKFIDCLKKTPCNLDENAMLLQVSEDQVSSRSYDLNIYNAELSVSALLPWLREILRFQDISQDDFQWWIGYFGAYQLGHVAGGVDGNGRLFVTVYYGGRTVLPIT